MNELRLAEGSEPAGRWREAVACPEGKTRPGAAPEADLPPLIARSRRAAAGEGARGMKRPGRPLLWTAEMIQAASDLICRYGLKHAAAMCGLTPTGLRMSLRYHGLTVRGIKAGRA